ncbi:hypothetical protein DSO57_1023199 [Entomophthora muscae]|uniref:Uncharacterized protein n=1 Tax=Entomophthora muscae TaxID=34485 RepID=A0ACC2U1B6_9FUNG|nr:hypothetical protein DSO57_1023199 [Entomophthora muscae]
MPVRCNFVFDVTSVDTDHSILFIEASSPAISTEIPDFGISQYYIRSLEHPRTCASLRVHFEAVAPSLKFLLTDALGFTSSMDIVTKNSMFNELDKLVLTSLAFCCTPALRVYQSSEAVKVFKGANKNVAQTVLQLQDPNLTPDDDAVAYFNSVFSQPDARL